MAIIEVNNLTKKFKDLIAVNNVTFGVDEGEIFGLLGPNGAGKSTLISMLCTLLYPTSGSATINGFDVDKQAARVREQIGIVFQSIILDDLLTAKENLRFFAKLGMIPKLERENRIDELLHLVDLYERKDDQVKYYSGGMRRRLEIARGLIFSPKVLFLDEATLGLDAQNRRIIWDYIKRLNKEKSVTILLTTHYIAEAEIANRVAIIDLGKIIELDTPKQLKAKVGDNFIKIVGKKENNIDLDKILSSLDFVEEVKSEKQEIYDEIKVYIKNSIDEAVPILIKKCIENGFKFNSIKDNTPTLEDVFIYYTGKDLRDKTGSGESTANINMRTSTMRRGARRQR